MKALLVEDNAADARLIREMLKDSPAGTFQLQQAARLDAALDRLRQEAFDVVLLDLGLPDAQGMEALTFLQKGHGGVPIVVLTGRDDEGFALEAVRTGAQDYLIKGRFDSQLLVRTVRYAVERKRAEASLQRERRRLHDVLETLPVMVCLLTPDHHLPFANGRFRQEFGEANGRRCHEYILGNAQPCEFCETYEVLKSGQPHQWECQSPDGRKILDVYAFPFTDSDGSPLILEMNVDITETRKAQAALREVNENLERRVADRTAALDVVARKFATMFDATSDGVWLHNLKGRILEVNDAYCRMSGYSREELTGMMISTLEAKETPEAVAQHIKRVLEQGWHDRFESQHRRKDGSLFDVDITALHLDIDGGRIAIFVRDITERKWVEAALREATQRLQALMEAVPVGISFSDDMTCQRIGGNHAVLAQFEVQREDNLSASAPDLTAPGRRVRFFKAGREISDSELPLQRAVAENRLIPPEEMEVELPSGRRWFCEASGAPVRDADGKVFAGIAVTTDITARKLAEGALVRAEKLAAVGRMAAAVAHEVNNPLAAVMNSVYLALLDPALNESTRQHLRIAEQELVRVAHLTRETLAFYRERSTAERMTAEDAIEEVLRTYEHRLRNKNVAVTKEIARPAGQITVMGELRQVLSNIVANSIDALPTGGRLHIRAHHSQSGAQRRLIITVADNGSGIDPELRERIFEPFFTTKQEFGTGLGLWVARELLRKHGSSIRMRSRPGVGTVFTISLPAPMAAVVSSGQC